MAFKVIEGRGRAFWAATDGSSTYRVGQIVAYNSAANASINGTVVPLTAASGAGDTTLKQVIAGVVVGINDRTPQSVGTTYYDQYRAGVVSSANQLATERTGQEGMYSKGDPQVMVQVQPIYQDTLLSGPIYTGTYGTAITLCTVSASTDADGMISANVTTNATQFTNVAHMGTIYCRSGKNAGIYRVSVDTSTTAPQVTTAFPYNVVAGDTFVRVPFKQGLSTINIPTNAMWISAAANPVIAGTDLFYTTIYKLNLAESGKEYAEFTFNADHFTRLRA